MEIFSIRSANGRVGCTYQPWCSLGVAGFESSVPSSTATPCFLVLCFGLLVYHDLTSLCPRQRSLASFLVLLVYFPHPYDVDSCHVGLRSTNRVSLLGVSGDSVLVIVTCGLLMLDAWGCGVGTVRRLLASSESEHDLHSLGGHLPEQGGLFCVRILANGRVECR